ncbi:DUF4368 domain-containing protein [endosymbiont 'TC1' of Trimyema compressum]|uniref:DUF4368 domain-containing protein n=1 Tax=endosymbiont 'TC1' of Trimyema compressum TaxID=243899 RepID=UPI003CCC1919
MQGSVGDLQASLAKCSSSENDVSRCVDSISQYTEIQSLTRSVVVELIDSIYVSERYEKTAKYIRIFK